MIKRVLFVCNNNVCCSPLAEGILRLRAKQAGLDLIVDSAAASGWHSGEAPDARAIVAAREHGFDISEQLARLLRANDFETAQLIIAMDAECLEYVESLRPEGAEVEITLMRRLASVPSEEDVPDPYYTGQFDPVIAVLEDCMPGLIAYLKGAQ